MSKSSFIRWQGRSIDQLRSSSHLFLALAGSALAFSATLLQRCSPLTFLGSALYHVQALGFLVSLLTGILLSVNRTSDFRTTARIARLREKDPNDNTLQALRDRSNELGTKSWKLYRLQLYSFFAAAILWLLFIAINFSTTLYNAEPVGADQPASSLDSMHKGD